jgi:3-hydroxyisobutyrate dehydrogenase-like beta-hydroxyacid dehydrogenase
MEKRDCTGQHGMSDVTVIGLGAMGSAMVRALLRDGHHVTVWNREDAFKEKAELALANDGALPAPDLASAVSASPVVIMCLGTAKQNVSNYEAAQAMLSAPDVRPLLSGRVLVQLSTGTPQEARDGERFARESGADYLDCAMWTYPEGMGTPDSSLYLAGPKPTFQRCEPLLRSPFPRLTHVGEKIGAASAIDCALLTLIYQTLIGAIHGALICEAEGVRVDEFGSIAQDQLETLAVLVKMQSDLIQENRFDDNPQGVMRTIANTVERIIRQAGDARINDSIPRFMEEIIGRGMKAGLGDSDLGALIKVLRGDT